MATKTNPALLKLRSQCRGWGKVATAEINGHTITCRSEEQERELSCYEYPRITWFIDGQQASFAKVQRQVQ
jgi:hypothetical protein